MNIFFGSLLIIIGLSVFFGALLFKFIFALILIVWGISVLTRKQGDRRWDRRTETRESEINDTVILSPFNKAIRSESFGGGKVVMILSGGELDLREAKPAGGEINLEIAAIMSGIKIFVPKTWRVVVHGTAILGGYRSHAETGGTVTLHINGAAILGGVDIVN